jgi:hypothetical protein
MRNNSSQPNHLARPKKLANSQSQKKKNVVCPATSSDHDVNVPARAFSSKIEYF